MGNRKFNYYLNCCSSINKSINTIKKENESLQNLLNSKIYKIDYYPKEIEVKEILEKIKSFGNVFYEFEFESCKNNLDEIPEYVLNGEKENIITKISKENWIRILSKNILEEQKEYNFKIKIIKSNSKKIMIGIAQITPDFLDTDYFKVSLNLKGKNKNFHKGFGQFPPYGDNVNDYFKKNYLMCYLSNKKDDIIKNYGWYFSLYDSSLFSDSPYNYRNQRINYNDNQNDIKININMKDKTFNLLTDYDYNIIQLYNNIPLNKPISLAILLYDEEDSIEIQPLCNQNY